MTGGDEPPEYNRDGIRRRRSSHYEDEDDLASAAQAAASTSPTTYHIGPPRRANTGPDAIVASSSSAVDSPVKTAVPRPSIDVAPRVRFSTDLERQPPSQAKRHSTGTAMDGASDGRKTPLPSGAPELRINTQGGTTAGESTVLGQGTVLSPEVVTSPVSPLATSQKSPISPTARNRGYSLRRTLFHRALEDHTTSPVSIMEMQDTAGFSGQSSSGQADGPHDRSTSNKKGNLKVVVSPVNFETANTSDGTSKYKDAKGTSALPNYENWMERKTRRTVISRRIQELATNAKKFVLRIQEIPPSKDGRHVTLDCSRKEVLLDERTSKPYISNYIRSTRYSAWNFLPRQLVAQFSKLANFYFLCVSILQMIPGLSTTGTYTTIVPLIFFVCISMAKEGYDDLRRHRLDKAENNREAKVLQPYEEAISTDAESLPSPPESSVGSLHWMQTKWQNLQVGDVVKLDRNEAAPADLVILHSSSDQGIAYVETMALDGETNLKSKQSAPSISKVCVTQYDVATCKAEFVVEDPNLDLYNFEGRVKINGETAPLTSAEIIYRGSVLRNTPSAIGMVIYSGEECRIRMNANKNPRIKAPALQSIVNKVVIVIVIFVIALSIFNTVAYQIWSHQTEDKSWYIANAEVAFFPILTSFIIMFNTMIPLSLYVSLEIIKLAQMYFLNDIDLYDAESDTPMEARTSTINEELGQVSYIFSDKTGTLTDNSMKFRKLSVAGTAWLHDTDLQKEAAEKKRLIPRKRSKGKKPARKSRDLQSNEESLALREHVDPANARTSNEASDAAGLQRRGSNWKSTARPGKFQPEMLTGDMIRYIQRKPYTLFARKARMFLLSLALCHTCLPEVQDNGEIEFLASSPDEHALVHAAQEMGFLVINRDSRTVTLKIMPLGNDTEPVLETYEVLDVIEFSSKRKRMSIVVRFPDQRICIFCKGADSVVMQRLKLATLANKKVVEIERRASKRKSLEAQYAIARKSEQLERKSSVGGRRSMTLSGAARASITIGRTSTTLGRGSVSGNRLSLIGNVRQPVRDELDQWLTERERDVDISSVDDNSIYYTPRPSAQLGRQSLALSAYSEPRGSLQIEEMDEFVDESLVADEPAVIERCFQHINDFATEGLRTLLYGYRFIDEQEYNAWKKVYLDATTSLINRQDMIESAGDLIEQSLDLAGATAIEDKLQHGVPESIDKLRRASIKMWMLTGDKRETAINIGHSCRLIKDYSSVTVLDHESGEVAQYIADAILAINGGKIAHSVVVVDGQTLATIYEDKHLTALFFDLAVLADSVICCRASPSQKAGLVKGIRKRVRKSITLAIGDGANDIAMIQEAHVGIGITGKEGLQAARTSDYSIAQFRFLTKLLLVHGRWNYIRTCKYTVGTFWKEMLFFLTQALFQRWAGYTGTSLYENWSLSMFNTLFTSLPVIFLGIFEKDLAASTLLAVPELYTKGQRNGAFNFKIYAGWMFMAASEAMVVFFVMLGVYGQAIFTSDQGLFALGDLCFSAAIVVISCKMQLIETHNRTLLILIPLICSIGGWWLWNLLLSALYNPHAPIYHVRDAFIHGFGTNALWWLTLVLILACVVVFELGVASLRAVFFTQDVDVFRALEKDEGVRRRFEEAARGEMPWSAAKAKEQGKGWGEEREEGMGEGLAEVTMVEEVAEERRREGEVVEMLARRPDLREQGRRSTDVEEALKGAFGRVREE